MKMFIAGEWTEASESIEVLNPYHQAVIDTVPKGTTSDVDRALRTLVEGAKVMRAMSAYDRSQILERAARLILDRCEEFARTISQEEGKVLTESRVEAKRAAEVIAISAEEARRITGEMIPLDGSENGQGKLGFTLRVPCGVVAAITPFNFPLNLVTHKVGPAIAGGNSVIVKPASDTPLSALKLTEVLLEAGLPDSAIACITGSGSTLGKAICSDDRVRKISFTGSYEVGDAICKEAGMKKVTMELGSNSPVIIMDDADLDKAAEADLEGGLCERRTSLHLNTTRPHRPQGRSRTSLMHLSRRSRRSNSAISWNESTTVGPMVREDDAVRVGEWIDEAVSAGAQLVTGGTRDGTRYQPTILDEVDANMRVSKRRIVRSSGPPSRDLTTSTTQSRWPTTRLSDSPPASSHRTSIVR